MPDDEEHDFCEFLLVLCSYFVVIIFFPFSMLVSFTVIREHERGLIFRFGRLKSRIPAGPGLIFVLRCIEKVKIRDVRITTLTIPEQSIVTKDSISVTIECLLYYKIVDPVALCMVVAKTQPTLIGVSSTTIRNVISDQKLSQIMIDRQNVCETIRTIINDGTTSWGIMIDRVEIFNLKINDNLQVSMAPAAEALKEAQLKKVSAEAEMKVAKALKAASDILAENPMALQLKYLDTLDRIATYRDTTIVFPIPIDIFAQKPRKPSETIFSPCDKTRRANSCGRIRKMEYEPIQMKRSLCDKQDKPSPCSRKTRIEYDLSDRANYDNERKHSGNEDLKRCKDIKECRESNEKTRC